MTSKNIEQLIKESGDLILNDKYDEAEQILNLIVTDDNYILAIKYFRLGNIHRFRNNLIEAREFYQKLCLEWNIEEYAKAQINLGCIYEQDRDYNQAIQYFKSVQFLWSARLYARAQNNLGFIARLRGNYEESENYYKSIQFEWSSEEYARAQNSLGVIARMCGNYDAAEEYYTNIQIEWSQKEYAKSQARLGYVMMLKKEYDKARKYYKNIQIEWDQVEYARAQLNLGYMCEQEQNQTLAIKYYKSISLEWSNVLYAKAQMNLANIALLAQDDELAFQYFDSIQAEWDKESYTLAQARLASFADINNEWDKAIFHLNNIQDGFGDLDYRFAQRRIFDLIVQMVRNQEQNIDFNHLQLPEFRYDRSCLEQIVKFNNDLLLDVYLKVQSIKNKLQIRSDSNEFHQSVAHYMQSSISLKILSNKDDDNFSSFRLSTVESMNDPKEGEIIEDWLNLPRIANVRLKNYAFASCFSFNHDSLNQFRLYGKQDFVETSGVSLIFSLGFFSSDELSTHINTGSTAVDSSEVLNEINETDNIVKMMDMPSKVDKYPLYSCIYFDPKTDYFKLARRSEYTFYNEFFNHETKKASVEYNKYINELIKQEQDIYKIFQALKNQINKLNLTDNHILNMLHELLLPLRYLIKHPAFEEEQECRMVVIKPLDKKAIKSQPQYDSFYIDYSVPVKDYVQKVYLGKGAQSKRRFFEYALEDVQKVRDSDNPFRVNR